MLERQKPNVPLVGVKVWLQQKLGGTSDLSPIGGQFWSARMRFVVVGRISSCDFLIWGRVRVHQAAVQLRSVGKPIPEFLEVGLTLDHHYALSRRHSMGFLDEEPVETAEQIGEAVGDLLHAVRSTPSGESVTWHEPSDFT